MRSNSLQIVPRNIPLNDALPEPEPVRKLNLPDYLESRCRALLVSEVAELLRISPRQVYKLAAERQLPSIKIAGCIRFDGVALASWLRNSTGGAM